MGGFSTYLKPEGPPLTARYRGQTLLCLASGLTRTFWALTSPEPGGVAESPPEGRYTVYEKATSLYRKDFD